MKPLLRNNDSAFELSCPHCHKHMTKVKAASVTLDRCDNCGGIWLDYNELQEGMKQGAGKLAKADAGGKREGQGVQMLRYCPRDKSLMVTMVDRKQAHIEFEQCTICGGMFLDAGELKDLTAFTLGERLKAMLS
ncbi:MAG: zf-TFIIB domain-containing protein [Phycisphaerales bacterium]